MQVMDQKMQINDTRNGSHPQQKQILDKKTAMQEIFAIYTENFLLLI